MTSNINPNNINGAFPVAGQDNNSQGFRTNFTNTSTNFQYAADEITDLQNKVILSSQLTGGNALSTQNNLQNAPLKNALVSGFSTPSVALGVLTGSVVINFLLGHHQTVTTGAPISLSFTNWPIAGQDGVVTVAITVTNPAYTVTLPAAVSINAVGLTGYNPSTHVLTFAAAGTYRFNFGTSSAGASISITNLNTALIPFNGSTDTVGTGNACSLATSTSFFAGTGTATLATGVIGQVKVLTQSGTGSTVVTVTNSAWGGNGHITLPYKSASLSLQSDGTTWWCIGNNGATFT